MSKALPHIGKARKRAIKLRAPERDDNGVLTYVHEEWFRPLCNACNTLALAQRFDWPAATIVQNFAHPKNVEIVAMWLSDNLSGPESDHDLSAAYRSSVERAWHTLWQFITLARKKKNDDDPEVANAAVDVKFQLNFTALSLERIRQVLELHIQAQDLDKIDLAILKILKMSPSRLTQLEISNQFRIDNWKLCPSRQTLRNHLKNLENYSLIQRQSERTGYFLTPAGKSQVAYRTRH